MDEASGVRRVMASWWSAEDLGSRRQERRARREDQAWQRVRGSVAACSVRDSCSLLRVCVCDCPERGSGVAFFTRDRIAEGAKGGRDAMWSRALCSLHARGYVRTTGTPPRTAARVLDSGLCRWGRATCAMMLIFAQMQVSARAGWKFPFPR